MDMMTSFPPEHHPAFSERWLTVVLAETINTLCSAAIWVITLPLAALAMLCVMAWDKLRSARPQRLPAIGDWLLVVAGKKKLKAES